MHIFPHRWCFSLLAFTGESSLAPRTWQRRCLCADVSTPTWRHLATLSKKSPYAVSMMMTCDESSDKYPMY
ncbi:Uncharacterized protein HZ326_17023 [Fusarium oxysporum f. sp. albedinis]|nr:Uncharacterized protein HZ326_17023 [Fusarium oxysporum f. sp. albedinis]